MLLHFSPLDNSEFSHQMNQHPAHRHCELATDMVEAMVLRLQEMGTGWIWSRIHDGRHRILVNEDPDLRLVTRSQLP
jgi:hypothetical protein